MEYSIQGIFIQPFCGNGFFDGNLSTSEGELSGQLCDAYGESIIEGHLDLGEGKMDFTKRYTAHLKRLEVEVNYVFSRNPQGIWAGTFNSQVTLSGETLCEICEKGGSPLISEQEWNRMAAEAKPSLDSCMDLSQSVIAGLIERGEVETYEDPETGEEMIKLKK
tara:strand:- start:477 stop:968 length:492 start_codon:yes stop_codon:yes gene_type:complete